MGKLIDLTGQRFGALEVLEKDLKRSGKNAYWICKCDCGKVVSKAGQGLRNGETTCCDSRTCPNKKFKGIDITNQKFGKLTALKPTEERKWNSIVWECQCECGKIVKIPAGQLTSGQVKSCGCLKIEKDHEPKGNVKDELGNKYGHLTVIARAGSDPNGQALWECECDCPAHTHIITTGGNLRKGHTQSCGCERRSHGELAVEKILIENNIPYQQEYPAFKFISGMSARFDFYINNQYFIEYDGETHYNFNLHGWHTEEQLKAQQERDAIKNQWCKDNNIPLIRIPYTHLKDLCLEDLLLETSQFVVNQQ